MGRIGKALKGWLNATFFDLQKEFHISFLPPLLIYLAAGLSGLTTIAGTFFIKDYMSISAAALAGVSFWAGLPWALKMSFGHMVDVFWRWKNALIILGAALVAASLLIMVAVIKAPVAAAALMPLTSWYITSVMLSALGMVIQDAVADAMSVEAVPTTNAAGAPLTQEVQKSLHTTMQTLGRLALFCGLIMVSLLNIYIFSGIEGWTPAAKQALYAKVYLLALIIPLISLSGILLKSVLEKSGETAVTEPRENTMPAGQKLKNNTPAKNAAFNRIFALGGLAVFALVVFVSLFNFQHTQEITFLGSLAIVLYLMQKLLKEMNPDHAKTLFGTALIIFIFRAVPTPGPGLTWFEIDVLQFDQQFLSVLTLITAVLTLMGMLVLRPLIANRSLTYIIILLTIFGGLLALPNIGLYYDLHHLTSALTGGVVDARFIAILDTALESPLGQIAMIPMLAWIARHAPTHLKATFFAVMASFTNLALSASSLLTKYMNEIFLVTREVKDPATKAITTPADYSALGVLLITVAAISVLAPVVAILAMRISRLKVAE